MKKICYIQYMHIYRDTYQFFFVKVFDKIALCIYTFIIYFPCKEIGLCEMRIQ